MENLKRLFQDMYRCFNDRNIEAVIAHMNRDVKWANGMEGGFVHGHDGVREYWTKQFKAVSSNVSPLVIDLDGESIKIKVHQVVYDIEGNLLSDEIVCHVFCVEDNKISLFEIKK